MKEKSEEERAKILSEGTDRLLFRGTCHANFGEYEILVEEEPPEVAKKKQRSVEDELNIVEQVVKKFNLEDNAPEEYESSQHKQWLRFQVSLHTPHLN